MAKIIIRRKNGSIAEERESNTQHIESKYNDATPEYRKKQNERIRSSEEKERRAKPIVSKAGITRDREAYKRGGKIIFE